MTRINAGVGPNELHRLHLIAEYRELPMVISSLRRSLRTRTINEILKDVPSCFTLNKGHVMFFVNKLKYLQKRYQDLKNEMRWRGYHTDHSRKLDLEHLDPCFFNDWCETLEARVLVQERISLRILQKPHLYQNG